MRCHMPLRSGYLVSSKACAAPPMPSIAAIAMIPSVLRRNMIVDSITIRLSSPRKRGPSKHRLCRYAPMLQQALRSTGSRFRGDDAQRAEQLQWLSSLVAPSTLSALRLEMAQVGRRLALLCRHQEPIGAEKVTLLADGDVIIVL